MTPALIPIPEAAALVSVHKDTIYAMARRGLVTIYKFGRASRVDPAEVIAAFTCGAGGGATNPPAAETETKSTRCAENMVPQKGTGPMTMADGWRRIFAAISTTFASAMTLADAGRRRETWGDCGVGRGVAA